MREAPSRRPCRSLRSIMRSYWPTHPSKSSFPTLDENMAAGLCYTSGTTGEPKGVLYSHRSTFLHALAGCAVDGGGMGEKEVVLSVVPMFHVNAWGLPYSCTMAGAKQVLPGPQMIGKPIAELIEGERVTSAAGVPTIWNLLYQYLKEQADRPYDLSSLHTVLVGGAAASRTLVESFEKDLGLPDPARLGDDRNLADRDHLAAQVRNARLDRRAKDGRAAQAGNPGHGGRGHAFSETKGKTSPGTASTPGSWSCADPGSPSSYYNNSGADGAFTADGWFRTGDIAMIDPRATCRSPTARKT